MVDCSSFKSIKSKAVFQWQESVLLKLLIKLKTFKIKNWFNLFKQYLINLIKDISIESFLHTWFLFDLANAC